MGNPQNGTPNSGKSSYYALISFFGSSRAWTSLALQIASLRGLGFRVCVGCLSFEVVYALRLGGLGSVVFRGWRLRVILG